MRSLFHRFFEVSSVILMICNLFTIPLSLTVSSQTETNYDPCTVFGNCLDGTTDYAQQDGSTAASSLILQIAYILIYLSAAVAVFFIILGSYKMIMSNGNDQEVKNGRTMAVNAVIGLILAIISVTIVQLVGGFVNSVDITPSTTPSTQSPTTTQPPATSPTPST